MAQVFHWPVESDEDCGGWPVEKQVVLELFEVARACLLGGVSAETVQDFD